MKPLRADILAIGSELLHGGRVDSNSVFIAEILAQSGIRVNKKIALSDEMSDIQAAVKASSKKVEVVILTGGLGSTMDDRTREAVATAFACPLTIRRKALHILRRQVQARGRTVTSLLRNQAFIPSGAMVLENFVGTAPGFYLRGGKSHVFALPGVPREAQEMMEHQVQPILQRKLQKRVFLWSHAFNTMGAPETEIQQRLSLLLQTTLTMSLSLLASTKGVKVTLSSWLPIKTLSKNSKEQKNYQERNQLIQQVRKALEPWLFSEGEVTMEEVVGQLCSLRKWNLALAESCTGGLIAHRLTDVPGSSNYLDRGLITYSNKAKQDLLGISPGTLRKYGAVSAQVAEAMAKGVRVKSHVKLGVGVTGIAGPGGGSIQKPVGLVYMAIDGPRGCFSQRYQFGGDRTEVKFRSSQAALDMIRRYLLQNKA